MSVRSLTVDESAAIYHQHIAPVLFPSATAVDRPDLAIVTGDEGAGSSRASSKILRESTGMARVSGAELAAFHPDYLQARTSTDAAVVSEAAAGWVQSAIRDARRFRRSLLIEGEGLSVSAVAGIIDVFGRNGFSTRLVLVASRRSDSLLALVAHHLLAELRGGSVAIAATGGAHTNRLASAVVQEASRGSLGAMTIHDRRGGVVFDESRKGTDDPFAYAGAALHAASGEPRTALEAIQWLSEVRRISEYVAAARRFDRTVVAALIELHEFALNEVIPALPVPRGSLAVGRQEREHAAKLVMLREMLAPSRAVQESGPAVSPPAIDPDGPSR